MKYLDELEKVCEEIEGHCTCQINNYKTYCRSCKAKLKFNGEYGIAAVAIPRLVKALREARSTLKSASKFCPHRNNSFALTLKEMNKILEGKDEIS